MAGNPSWERDEVVLALDLYVESGSLNGGPILGPGTDEVQELSGLLNALQLLDYRRFHEPRPKCAVLLPQKPSRDLLDLLDEHDVGCVWEKASGGFRDNRKQRLS